MISDSGLLFWATLYIAFEKQVVALSKSEINEKTTVLSTLKNIFHFHWLFQLPVHRPVYAPLPTALTPSRSIPQTRNKVAERAFSISGPTACSSIPRRQLKSHFLQLAFHSIDSIVLFLM